MGGKAEVAVAVTPATNLGPDVSAALARHVITLADSKRLLGIRYSDWLLGSPSIETGIAASSMAQDEWGHARMLYAMLKDLGLDPAQVERDRPAEEYASIDVLDRPFTDWAEVVTAMLAVDGALSLALESFAGGTFEPARSRIPKMLAEEVFHRDLGAAWFSRLASGSEAARRRLAAAVRDMVPRTMAWLDPADAPHRVLYAAGLVGAGSLDAYRAQVGPLFDRVGVRVAAIEPNREGWDAARGRGRGHPDEEAVERARGDKNRALLVE
jgi:1,2-phenylacetyl-CoA epoxidase catalytic subunit